MVSGFVDRLGGESGGSSESHVSSFGSGVVPGVIGHVGDVTVEDSGGLLRVTMDLEGFMDATVPGPLGNPFVYQVSFTTDHNGVEQLYALQYTYESDPLDPSVVVDRFALSAHTNPNAAGVSSVCPVDADLSASHFEVDEFRPVWVVDLDEFDHAVRTEQGDCSMSDQRDGRGLEAGDTLREIVGSATLKVAVVQFSDFQDTTHAEDYMVQGDGGPAQPEQVRLLVDGEVHDTIVVSTDDGSPSALFEGSVDLTGKVGSVTLTAKWFDEDDILLASDHVVVHVEQPGPGITIDSPVAGETVGPDFTASGTFSSGEDRESPSTDGEPQHMRIPVPEGAVWNMQEEYDPLLPGLAWNDAIGPGTPIAISFTPGATFPEFVCTANWVWKDHTGDVYLGAAGHCFLPTDTRTTHGDSGDVRVYDPSDVTVWACAGDCVAGGFTGDVASIFLGNYLRLGPVEYARQKPADGRLDVDGDGIGYDFGIVRIPDEMLSLVDTSMPVWGGPDESFTGDSFLMPMALHGSGVLYGETFATKSRIGESLGSLDARHWEAVIPSFGGDSGSSVSVFTDFVPTGTPAAHGLLTHGIIGAPYAIGTLIGWAAEMAYIDAGICLRPLMADEDPVTADPAPGCEDTDPEPPEPVEVRVQVRLSDGDWVDVADQANGTWSHSFAGTAPGGHELHARLVDTEGLVLAAAGVSFFVEEDAPDCPSPGGNGPPGQGCGTGAPDGPPCRGKGQPQAGCVQANDSRPPSLLAWLRENLAPLGRA
jgi:hypothetical protein